jgi:hypothetical protein
MTRQITCNATSAATGDCVKGVADMWARDPGPPFAGFDAAMTHIGTAVVLAPSPAKDRFIVVSHFGKA